MNQPKFKFGDKVVKHDRYSPSIFVIGSIEWSDLLKRYEYGSICGNYAIFTEEGLELYQEPQKKKLYAYKKDSLESVRFSTVECNDFLCSQFWDRAPEYDLEYPEKDV